METCYTILSYVLFGHLFHFLFHLHIARCPQPGTSVDDGGWGGGGEGEAEAGEGLQQHHWRRRWPQPAAQRDGRQWQHPRYPKHYRHHRRQQGDASGTQQVIHKVWVHRLPPFLCSSFAQSLLFDFLCENNRSDTSSPSYYFTLLPHGTVSPEYFFLNLKPCLKFSLKTPPADCLGETRASKRRRNCRSFIREEPDQRKTLAGKTETIHQTDSVNPKHMCVCARSLFSPSAEQIQVDFVEMLRVRNEKRRLRHVEALRRQKLMEEDQLDGGRITRAEQPGDSKNEDQGDQVFSPVTTSPKPSSPLKTAFKSPNSSPSGSPSGSPSADTTHRQVRWHHWVHKIFVFEIE